MIPDSHRCFDCDGYLGTANPTLACTCDRTEPALSEDPDERMMLLRGCTVAQYEATTAEYLQRGHA